MSDAEPIALSNEMAATIMIARRLFEVARDAHSARCDAEFVHLRAPLKRARLVLKARIQDGDESIETSEQFREVCYFLGGHE